MEYFAASAKFVATCMLSTIATTLSDYNLDNGTFFYIINLHMHLFSLSMCVCVDWKLILLLERCSVKVVLPVCMRLPANLMEALTL